MYEYRAKILKVVDADTLRLAVDLGCDTTLNMTVRLAYVNAPERGTAEGDAATGFTINWLIRETGYLNDTDHWIQLRTLKDRKEKYGRYLAIIGSGGNTLNDALVEAGHAEYRS